MQIQRTYFPGSKVHNIGSSQFSEASRPVALEVVPRTTQRLDASESIVSRIREFFALLGEARKQKKAATVQDGAMIGAQLGGRLFPGYGHVIGAVVGGVGGFLSNVFSSGKHKDQKARDSMRTMLQQAGFIDEHHQVQLPHGGPYDIGLDGGSRFQNVDGSERAAYDVDFSDPRAEQTVALLNPLGEVLAAGEEKLKTDLVGYLTNAVLSGAQNEEQIQENILALYMQAGISPQNIERSLSKLLQEEAITLEEFKVYQHDLGTLTVVP